MPKSVLALVVFLFLGIVSAFEVPSEASLTLLDEETGTVVGVGSISVNGLQMELLSTFRGFATLTMTEDGNVSHYEVVVGSDGAILFTTALESLGQLVSVRGGIVNVRLVASFQAANANGALTGIAVLRDQVVGVVEDTLGQDLPSDPGELPEPGELPVDPGQLPSDPAVLADEVLGTVTGLVGELPVDPGQLPSDPGQLPSDPAVLVDEVLGTVTGLVGELPVDPGQLPNPGDLPVDPNQLPVDPGQLPNLGELPVDPASVVGTVQGAVENTVGPLLPAPTPSPVPVPLPATPGI